MDHTCQGSLSSSPRRFCDDGAKGVHHTRPSPIENAVPSLQTVLAPQMKAPRGLWSRLCVLASGGHSKRRPRSVGKASQGKSLDNLAKDGGNLEEKAGVKSDHDSSTCNRLLIPKMELFGRSVTCLGVQSLTTKLKNATWRP